jgi:hypothetical protein
VSPEATVIPRHDLGIFARTFPRASAAEVAGAVAAAGFGLVQLNLSAVGLPTLPGPAELGGLDFGAIRRAFDAKAIRIWGLSASYNMIHPDPAIREAQTEAAGLLAGWIFCLHAKDVVDSGYAAAGMGRLDYGLIARLLAGLPAGVPLIAQDAAEDDVARVRDLLLTQAGPAGLQAPEPLR